MVVEDLAPRFDVTPAAPTKPGDRIVLGFVAVYIAVTSAPFLFAVPFLSSSGLSLLWRAWAGVTVGLAVFALAIAFVVAVWTIFTPAVLARIAARRVPLPVLLVLGFGACVANVVTFLLMLWYAPHPPYN